MNLALVFSFFTVLSCATSTKESRIVGGQDAAIASFPYQAALVFPDTNRYMCGGVIITKRHILTAAHCIFDIENFDVLRVYLGMGKKTSRQIKKYRILTAYIHPGYPGEVTDFSRSYDDIAVILLRSNITFNAHQNKIDLPTADYEIGSIVKISGWGLTNFPVETSSVALQKAKVTIIAPEACSRIFNFSIRPDQICTLHRHAVGVCVGDSGGPVVYRNKLIGIISFNAPCAKGAPDVHTNVYSYLRFITAVIAVHVEYP